MKTHRKEGIEARYSGPAIALHWAVAALVAVAAGLGIFASDLPPTAPAREALLDLHRSIGVALFALFVLRAAWRAARPPPEPVSGVPWLQRAAAKIAHLTLYVLLAVVPVMGYLLTNFDGEAVSFLGRDLPSLAERDAAAGRVLGGAHSFFAWTLLAIAGMHALAALKHHYLDGDETLARIAPWLRSPRRR